MDRNEGRQAADAIATAARYPADPNGILTSEGLRQACDHVWRDSNSSVMLGSDPLNSEPVSSDDKDALEALRRHIAAAGRRSFVSDVLPRLGFGPTVKRAEPRWEGTVVCAQCGVVAEPLHLGCRFCEECCDCRPLGT